MNQRHLASNATRHQFSNRDGPAWLYVRTPRQRLLVIFRLASGFVSLDANGAVDATVLLMPGHGLQHPPYTDPERHEG